MKCIHCAHRVVHNFCSIEAALFQFNGIIQLPFPERISAQTKGGNGANGNNGQSCTYHLVFLLAISYIQSVDAVFFFDKQQEKLNNAKQKSCAS